MEEEAILKKLRQGGFRITKVRKAIVEFLDESPVPLSAAELGGRLTQSRIPADRTTLYRELLFLESQNIIHDIPFGDGKKRYRVCPSNHHHHLICLRCRRVEDIVLKKGLRQQEKEITTERQFKVVSHTLEFFGFCKDCQE